MTDRRRAAARAAAGLVRATVRSRRPRPRATRARKAARGRARRRRPGRPGAASTLPLAHLDRPFDYAVPAAMADDGACRAPGSRCASPARTSTATSSAAGPVRARRVGWRRCVGWSAPSRCSRPRSRAGAAVAERYAGTRSDVLRLAVPPRHATTEKEPSSPEPAPVAPTRRGRRAGLGRPRARGRPFLRHLAEGGMRRARSGAPRPATTGRAGRPRGRAPRCAGGPRRAGLRARRQGRRPGRRARSTELLGDEHHVALTADAGPAARYRDFLAVSRGARRIVVGTRAAAFAPVHDLGPGRDLGRRRRPARRAARALPAHPRDAAAARRAARARPPWSAASRARVEAEYLVRTGWAHELGRRPGRAARRVTVAIAGATDARPRRDAQARAARMPRQVHTRSATRLERRAGPGPDPAPGLRRRAGLRALPHAGPLRRLRRARSR